MERRTCAPGARPAQPVQHDPGRHVGRPGGGSEHTNDPPAGPDGLHTPPPEDLRTGFGREIPLDTLHAAAKSIRLEAGLALRSIDYTLDQIDHTTRVGRNQRENWLEWTRTWGLAIRFSDLELRYVGRMTTGTG